MRIWAFSAILAGALASTSAVFAQAPPQAPAQPPAHAPAQGPAHAPAQAAAQPARSDEATTAEAKERFKEGIAFADAGNHEAARLKFSQAWTLLKSPAILYNLARSEQLSGHLVEALEHFRLFGKMASDPKVTEQQRQRAMDNVAELSKKVGQIDIEAPAGARITVDGKPVDWTRASDPIPVLPGKHDVIALVDGNALTTTVECVAGTVTKAKLEAPKSATPAPSTPSATATPGAAGGPGASSTSNGASAEAGSKFWTTGRIAGAGIAAGGVIAVGLGLFFHVDGASADDDRAKKVTALGSTSACNPSLPTKPADCSAIADLHDQAQRDAVLRNTLWIGGGALLAGGAVLFLLASPKAQAPKTGVRILPTLGGATLLGIF